MIKIFKDRILRVTKTPRRRRRKKSIFARFCVRRVGDSDRDSTRSQSPGIIFPTSD